MHDSLRNPLSRATKIQHFAESANRQRAERHDRHVPKSLRGLKGFRVETLKLVYPPPARHSLSERSTVKNLGQKTKGAGQKTVHSSTTDSSLSLRMTEGVVRMTGNLSRAAYIGVLGVLRELRYAAMSYILFHLPLNS